MSFVCSLVRAPTIEEFAKGFDNLCIDKDGTTRLTILLYSLVNQTKALPGWNIPFSEQLVMLQDLNYFQLQKTVAIAHVPKMFRLMPNEKNLDHHVNRMQCRCVTWLSATREWVNDVELDGFELVLKKNREDNVGKIIKSPTYADRNREMLQGYELEDVDASIEKENTKMTEFFGKNGVQASDMLVGVRNANAASSSQNKLKEKEMKLFEEGCEHLIKNVKLTLPMMRIFILAFYIQVEDSNSDAIKDIKTKIKGNKKDVEPIFKAVCDKMAFEDVSWKSVLQSMTVMSSEDGPTQFDNISSEAPDDLDEHNHEELVTNEIEAADSKFD